MGDLMARVRVSLRHAATAHADTGDPVFVIGQLNVIYCTVGLQSAGMVLTHRQLLKEVWGPWDGE
jgi:hypothetical protein